MGKKKLFVVSDIHSFYTPLLEALDKAGFDKNNESHYLIVCGDAFDRGPDSVEVLQFLMSLDRKILIKGNHDDMFETLCKRGYPQYYDTSNGTLGTVLQLSGGTTDKSFKDCCDIALSRTQAYRNSLVNYFETKCYIFVHSWIPTVRKSSINPNNKWSKLTTHNYMEDWRQVSDTEWDEAMWGNPFELAKLGLNQTGKTIVFGHWHCSAAWAKEEERSEFGPDAEWNPYYGKDIIGIDRCTAHTGEVNVLVLEDEFIETN